jgi:hypothetical protein
MYKLVKLAALVALSVVSLASSASATTWTSNGPKAFDASTGSSRFVIKDGSGQTVTALNCTTTGTIGTLAASASFPSNAATLTPRLSNCTWAGQTFSFTCNTDNPGGSSANLKALGFALGVTRMTLTQFSCVYKIGPTVCTTISGSIEGSYTNPDLMTLASGFFTLFVARQQLTMTTSACTAIATGTPSFGAPSGTGITDLVIPMTTPSAPGAQPSITGV